MDARKFHVSVELSKDVDLPCQPRPVREFKLYPMTLGVSICHRDLVEYGDIGPIQLAAQQRNPGREGRSVYPLPVDGLNEDWREVPVKRDLEVD
ncbi:MAG TPA: hypothetical protein VLA61_10350 [Ideonella sp.]|uniref:hypothetical protein n=1 Tax=Ideonella sp. TaxID=1929293 RepID=UPI002CE35105|nr:hypothetical protein [Ideonella sp.]HSI48661.1 hypothetical protein [Ideonella sp.]